MLAVGQSSSRKQVSAFRYQLFARHARYVTSVGGWKRRSTPAPFLSLVEITTDYSLKLDRQSCCLLVVSLQLRKKTASRRIQFGSSRLSIRVETNTARPSKRGWCNAKTSAIKKGDKCLVDHFPFTLHSGKACVSERGEKKNTAGPPKLTRFALYNVEGQVTK